MARFNAKDTYKKIKKRGRKSAYEEEKHCILILSLMNQGKTIPEFCKEVGIGDTTFHRWLAQHPTFDECYRLGVMIDKANWEAEGLNNKDNLEFNASYWKEVGRYKHGLGKTAPVRVAINANSNPYEQYKQLMKQASKGDFTATDLKLLMESINAGTRAYESFELQKSVDEMKDDLIKMSTNNGDNIIPIESFA